MAEILPPTLHAMNASLLAMLNDAEKELVRATEPAALDALDEDALADLHDRVRRARNKYSKLYRRRAAQQVGADASRGRASAVNQKAAAKAEVFEEILSVVSRRLAAAAKQAAAELKAERLAAAKAVKETGAARMPTPGKGKGTPTPVKGGRGDAALRSPASKKATASTRAAGKRAQAKRDQR